MDLLTPTHQSIVAEISGRIHLGVDGFFEKYFAHNLWSLNVAQSARESSHKRASSLHQFVLEYPSETSYGGQNYVFRSRAPGENIMPVVQRRSCAFLVPNELSDNYTWAHIQVIGQFEEDTVGKDYLRGFLRLYEQAQEVFTSQPTRLFLHGFYVFGSMTELWLFDRSGFYCCKPFDAGVDLRQFIVTISGYKRMSDAELGINTRIKKGEAGKYIMFQGDNEHEASRLYLDDEPIAFPRRISRRGVTADGQGPQGLGVVQSFGHQQLDTISNIRRGMLFGVPQKLRFGASVTTTSTGDTNTTTQLPEHTNIYFIGARAASPKGAMEKSFLPFENLVLSCLVVHPIGYPAEFSNILEFLESCRDAVKGHQSLFLNGNILHQDVSVGNIIIPATKKPGQPRGILIDLDFAMDLAVGPQAPGELFGTKPFMAIDLLAGTPHTYRHDIESFFYVFLWVAICGGDKDLPTESRLQRWLVGNWHQLSRKKKEDMEEEENFSEILSEFSPEFKGLEGLAWKLRKVLFFPLTDDSFLVETRHESEEVHRLYEWMVGAFQDAIDIHVEKVCLGEV